MDDLRAAMSTIESRADGVDHARAHVADADANPDADDETAPRSIEDARADAEKISMRTLGRRGVSTAELRTALRRHELDADVIEHEIDRLTRVGLLDDEQLAADLVDRLHDRKGLGRQGVSAELRRRGIEPAVVEQVLAGDDPEDDDAAEAERALELAVKRAGQMRGLDRETAERRLSGFLMRKGYNGAVVRSAVRTALDGAGPRGGGVRFS
ncbi:regulatory protein RecX [Curtobacterium sp. RRHDQ10]|uniref:regulatory protein RecX n=1 Tax=Curtobacterium phyllosphaerae TaxID=3413379 RepID=UPI003BF02139